MSPSLITDSNILTAAIKAKYDIGLHIEKPSPIKTRIGNLEAVINKTKSSLVIMFTRHNRTFFKKLFRLSKSANYVFKKDLTSIQVVRSAYHSIFIAGLFANRGMWFAILLTVILQMLIVYVSFSETIFKTTALNWHVMKTILSALVACMLGIELIKYLTNRFGKVKQ